MEYSGYNEVHTYYSRTLKSQNRVYILGQWKWNLTLSWLTNWKKKKKKDNITPYPIILTGSQLI